MKVSTREIIEQALVECGAISPAEDVDYDEVDKALFVLNRLIGRYNADSLFAYTKYRHTVDVDAGKSEYTIGIGDGNIIRHIEEVETDRIKITFARAHGYDTDDFLNIYDTTNYDGVNYRVYAVTERTVTLLKPYVYQSTLVEDDGTSLDVTLSDTSAFEVGDVVNVLQPYQWVVSGTVVSKTSTVITLGSTNLPAAFAPSQTEALVYRSDDATVYGDEYTGVVYKNTDIIPDIRKTRPNDLEVCNLIDNGAYFRLDKLWETTWDHSLLNENISGSYLPRYFTYYSDYPFGKVKFESTLDKAYKLELIYQFSLDGLELDTIIDMPDAYVDLLTMILADGLCPSYGIDNPRIKMEASSAITAIRKMNITPSTVDRGIRGFDIYSGRYR